MRAHIVTVVATVALATSVPSPSRAQLDPGDAALHEVALAAYISVNVAVSEGRRCPIDGARLEAEVARILQRAGIASQPYDAGRFVMDSLIETGDRNADLRRRPALLTLNILSVDSGGGNCAIALETRLEVLRPWLSLLNRMALNTFVYSPSELSTADFQELMSKALRDTPHGSVSAHEDLRLIVATDYHDAVRDAVRDEVATLARRISEGRRAISEAIGQDSR